MPKKNDIWNGGMPKGPIGPFVWQVWIKGSKKPSRVVAFDLEHIKNQLQGEDVIKAKQLPGERRVFRFITTRSKRCCRESTSRL